MYTIGIVLIGNENDLMSPPARFGAQDVTKITFSVCIIFTNKICNWINFWKQNLIIDRAY